ncbi:MAG: transposase [Myxococcales bacterium]|nr:transposase [Myxococcales bacterium]
MAEARSGGKGRKRHVQQLLFNHGGKRRGAGRKPKSERAGEAHAKRKDIDGRDALHVVLRVAPEVGNLRRNATYQAVRAATEVAARRGRFRICQLSIQRTHIHMIAEAEDAMALAHGMQGFEISAARNINTALGTGGRRRKGRVFVDRYHVVVIRSPKQMRRALSYCLNNFRKHREDRGGTPSTWLLDPFSSAVSFDGWKELEGMTEAWQLPGTYRPLVVSPAQSWLQRVGWKIAGEISARDVPSARDRPRAV